MNGVDLRLFQFDYDQTLAAFFLNADGTIYGRYGTRAGNGAKSSTHVSLASFGKAMERALALHRGYPNNREKLAAKRGPEPEYPTVNAIPGFGNRPARVNREGQGCLHCHQARDTPLRLKWETRQLKPTDLYVYPLPENTGMKLVVDDGLRVESVFPGTPAARAGLQPGDELRTLEGQPLVSQADIQWVLHRASAAPTLTVEDQRGGQPRTAKLALAGDWKKTDLTWRPSSGPGLRWGVWCAPLMDEERAAAKIPSGAMALKVTNLFGARAAPVAKAGVQVGDVILAADGRSDFANEGEYLAYLRLNHPPGDRFKLTLLRDGRKVDLEVPMW
jgi:hypothetical protein